MNVRSIVIGAVAVLVSAFPLACSAFPSASSDGVKLISDSGCINKGVSEAFSYSAVGRQVVIKAAGSFDCNRSLESPKYISLGKRKTLFIRSRSKYFFEFASAGCICGREVQLSLENILNDGDTLYLVIEEGVASHHIISGVGSDK